MEINNNMGDDTPFLNFIEERYIFVKFVIELLEPAVKILWLGGYSDIYMLKFSADCRGFAAAL